MSNVRQSLNLQVGDTVVFHGEEVDESIEDGLLAEVIERDDEGDFWVEAIDDDDGGWYIMPDGRLVDYPNRDDLFVTLYAVAGVTGNTTSSVVLAGQQVRIVSNNVSDDDGVPIHGLFGQVWTAAKNHWNAPLYVGFEVSNGAVDGFFINADGTSPEWPGTYVLTDQADWKKATRQPKVQIDWKAINEKASAKPAKPASPQAVRKSVDQIMAEVEKRAADYLQQYMAKVPKINPSGCTIEYAHRAPNGTIIPSAPGVLFQNVPRNVNGEMCEPVKRYIVTTEWVNTP